MNFLIKTIIPYVLQFAFEKREVIGLYIKQGWSALLKKLGVKKSKEVLKKELDEIKDNPNATEMQIAKAYENYINAD